MCRKIIVLSGNREQFEEYLKENSLNREDFVFGDPVKDLSGVVASKILEIGTFRGRNDCELLSSVARTQVKELEVENCFCCAAMKQALFPFWKENLEDNTFKIFINSEGGILGVDGESMFQIFYCPVCGKELKSLR